MILTNPFSEEGTSGTRIQLYWDISCRIYNLLREILKSCENINILKNFAKHVYPRSFESYI